MRYAPPRTVINCSESYRITNAILMSVLILNLIYLLCQTACIPLMSYEKKDIIVHVSERDGALHWHKLYISALVITIWHCDVINNCLLHTTITIEDIVICKVYFNTRY